MHDTIAADRIAAEAPKLIEALLAAADDFAVFADVIPQPHREYARVRADAIRRYVERVTGSRRADVIDKQWTEFE